MISSGTEQLQHGNTTKQLLADYKPLLIGFGIIIGATTAAGLMQTDRGSFSVGQLMNSFMGIFFLVFALPKFMDLRAFATAFRQYDLVSQRFKSYASTYPYIEVGLGLAYLIGLSSRNIVASFLVNGLVIFITSLASIGIIRSIRKKESLSCACMGANYSFPLSRVSLFENGLMLVMAVGMLLFIHMPSMSMAGLMQLRLLF